MKLPLSGGVSSSNGIKQPSNMLFTKDYYRSFSKREHEYLSEDNPRREYVKVKDKSIVHYGQLKLFLANVQLINKYWDSEKIPKPKLLYIGSAPGSWVLFFAEMFPTFELHLYDSTPFDVTLQGFDMNNPKINVEHKSNRADIYLYKRYFVEDDVKMWKETADSTFLVSDIRPLTYNCENESEVHDDMMRQQKWVTDINPIYSQLKFKLPYKETDTNMYSYLDGRIYFQSFVGHSSTEARLVSQRPYNMTEYNFKEYEAIMFYHNTVIRNIKNTAFNNVFNGKSEPYALLGQLGLYNDWDSTSLIITLKEFIEKVSIDITDIKEEHVFSLFDKLEDAMELSNIVQRKEKGVVYRRNKLIDQRKI